MQKRLAAALQPHGLCALGGFAVTAEDGLAGNGTLALIGPDEPVFWAGFSQSEEYSDSLADPLDRWSKRVLTGIANDLAASAYFPFGDAPYLPFHSWALRTGRFWAAPIGFLVHDTAGLFASFRGALLLPETVIFPTGESPCMRCDAQPCLTACPVDAFAGGYDVPACKTHLNTPQGADCMDQGCRARRACPVGQGNRLPAQATHHMKAFR